jgi:ankyrin repeat protein
MARIKLLKAAEAGNIEKIKECLANPRTNPFVSDNSGHMPLDLACMHGHLAAVKLLWEKYHIGADLKSKALYYACIKNHPDIVAYLLKDPDIQQELKTVPGVTFRFLPLACERGFLDVAKLLCQRYPLDINKKNIAGYTPIHLACLHGHTAIVTHLLSYPKIDLSTTNTIDTALSCLNTACSATNSNPQIVAALLFSYDQHKIPIPSDLSSADPMIHGWLREKDLVSRRKSILPYVPIELRRAAAQLFAQTIFLCDGFLAIRGASLTTPAGRFFQQLMTLPMDMQIVLCNRTFGLPANTIPSALSEQAFRAEAHPSAYPATSQTHGQDRLGH